MAGSFALIALQLKLIDLIERKSPELNQKRFSVEDCGCVPHHPLKNKTPSAALCSLLSATAESTYYLT